MSEHKTTEGVYGPGTYTDTEFTPVPRESRRLLEHLASITPGFTNDAKAFEDVEFTGADLTIIPGPLKAQPLVCSNTFMVSGVVTDQSIVCSRPGDDRYRV